MTAGRSVLGARLTLIAGGAVAGILMLGPFQGAERFLLLSDKQAHTVAFFTLTALSFLALPKHRRNDLAVAALALGAAIEVAQLAVGRSASLLDLSADAVGVLMAWAPAQVESLRRRSRAGELERRARGAELGQTTARAQLRMRPALSPPTA